MWAWVSPVAFGWGSMDRLALVLVSPTGAAGGAEDPGEPELSFARAVADGFATALASVGGWELFSERPVECKNAGAARTAIHQAAGRASDAGTPLLIHYIGHARAVASGDENAPATLYLQFEGSGFDPDAETSLDVLATLQGAANATRDNTR